MKKADIVLKSNAVFDSIGNMPFSGGVAIKGNRILAVIKGDGIDEYIGPDTKVFQYENQLIMPGFVDAHTHFFDGAVTSSDHMCDLSPSTSELEAVEMLKQYASTHPNEKRLRGIGWLPANWQDEGLPSKKSLDEAFPNIPVYCISADIHTFWMNSKALEESGYTPDFQPPSGSVGKYENGELNGLIFEPAAFEQAMEKTMEFDKEPLIALLKGFMAGIAKNGINSVSEMSSYSYKDSVYKKLSIVKELSESNEMFCRLHVYTQLSGHEDFSQALDYQRQFWNDKFRVVGVKGFVDGVTSTYTGYLLEPYEDRPDTRGIDVPIEPQEAMEKYIVAANAAGLPVRLHCLGDAAVRMALDMYETSIKINGKHGLKNTIEHIENIHPDDISRFSELDVIPSLQPLHLTLDLNEKIQRLGKERCRWEWPHRSFLDSGAKLAFGTDYPVVGFNPFPTLHSAVTRWDYDNKPTGCNPEERIELHEAIKAYTIGSANVYNRAHELGTLEEGKLSDIIVVDRNLFAIEQSEIKDANVLLTIMDGKIIYER